MSTRFNRTMVSSLALAAALGLSTAAIGGESTQTKTYDSQAQPEATQTNDALPASETASGDQAQPMNESTAENGDVVLEQSQDDEMTASEERAAASDEPTSPVVGQIIWQDEDTFLVSSLIGTNVYTPNGDTIGDINDVLAGKDGTVQGIVIGVGGFLGLGEKDVAIRFERIELTDTEDGDVRLVLNTTAEELENAPEFKTVEVQRLEQEQKRMQDEMQQSQDPNVDGAPEGAAGTAGSTE